MEDGNDRSELVGADFRRHNGGNFQNLRRVRRELECERTCVCVPRGDASVGGGRPGAPNAVGIHAGGSILVIEFERLLDFDRVLRLFVKQDDRFERVIFVSYIAGRDLQRSPFLISIVLLMGPLLISMSKAYGEVTPEKTQAASQSGSRRNDSDPDAPDF